MKRPFLSCIVFLVAVATNAQSIPDAAFMATSEEILINRYEKHFGSESPLYIGSDYAEYVSQNDEHPFFLEDDWFNGEIQYADHVYTNVPLQFDIQSQKVIAEHISSKQKIQLVSENVEWFSISNHRFVRLDKTNTPGFAGSPGFYDLLVEGDLKLYAVRRKIFKQVVVNAKFESQFTETSDYFFRKNQTLYPVNSKSSALNALADKKSIIQKELKKKKISFRRDRERALVETARIYNNLPH